MLLQTATAISQNLFDSEHTQRYAEYLLNSGQFALAAEEYERLVFMQPTHEPFKIGLLRALSNNGDIAYGRQKWQLWQQTGSSFSTTVHDEYAKLLLQGDFLSEVRSLSLQPNRMSKGFGQQVGVFAAVLGLDWENARNRLDSVDGLFAPAARQAMSVLIQKGAAAKKKSPALALGLSAIVPGTGKVYSGQWKDGLLSFFFVGLNGWQAYRRFDEEGTGSVWGWVHAGLGTGFYIGNLYGSHKAARRFNAATKRRLKNEAKTLVFPMLH